MSTGDHHPINNNSLLVPNITQRLSALNSAHSSDTSLHRVKDQPGYNTPVFKGKDEQRALVEQAVAAKVR